MEIFSTRCWDQIPVMGGRYRDCISFLGQEPGTWLWMLVLSAMLGFGAYSFYSFIGKTPFNARQFALRSLVVSFGFLVLVYVFWFWWTRQFIS